MAYSKKSLKKRKKLLTQLKEITNRLEKEYQKSMKEYEKARTDRRYIERAEKFREITGSKHKRKAFGYNRSAGTAKLQQALRKAKQIEKLAVFKEGYGVKEKHMKETFRLQGFKWSDEDFENFKRLMSSDIVKWLLEKKYFGSEDVREYYTYHTGKAMPYLDAFGLVKERFKNAGSVLSSKYPKRYQDADAMAMVGLADVIRTRGLEETRKLYNGAMEHDFDDEFEILGRKYKITGQAKREKMSSNTIKDFLVGVELLESGELENRGMREKYYYYNMFMQYVGVS